MDSSILPYWQTRSVILKRKKKEKGKEEEIEKEYNFHLNHILKTHFQFFLQKKKKKRILLQFIQI